MAKAKKPKLTVKRGKTAKKKAAKKKTKKKASKTPAKQSKKSSKKRGKASRKQVVDRVFEAVELITKGQKTHPQICRFLSQKWKMSRRNAERYVAAANREIAKAYEGNIEQTVGREIAKRENLYAEALKAKEYRTALEIRKDIAKLVGIYPKEDDSKKKALHGFNIYLNDGKTIEVNATTEFDAIANEVRRLN